MVSGSDKTPKRHDSCHVSPAPVATPALLLAWMIVGIIATLPELTAHRFSLTLIALMPATAAWWSQTHRHGALVWGMVAALLWGGCVVWMARVEAPELPESLAHQKVTLQGVVADREDRGDSVLLTLDEIRSDSWNPQGMLRVTLHRHATSVLPGERISLVARVRPLNAVSNPGAFDYRQFLLESGIEATATSSGPVTPLEQTGRWFCNRQRQRIADWIAVTLPPAQRGLAEALLVGKRGHLDGELQNALFVSGTFHLVAISGLHLSLVGGTVYFLLRLALTLILPLSRRLDMKRPAALLTLLPVTAYAFLAGWSVSTQRAFIMVGLFLLAIALQRRRQSWRMLTLAALLILSWRPSQLLNAGFQLSFLCVAVILYLIDRLPATNWRERLLLSVTSTISIGVATAPLSLYAFHRLSPYSIGINLLAIPWVGELSTTLGLLAMVLQPLWPDGGHGLLTLTGWTLERYRELVEWSVTWPGAELRTPGPALPGVALFVALGMIAARMRAASGRWEWRRPSLIVAALLGLCWPKETTPDQALRVIVLDVGQALSVMAKMPGGGWSLFDAGGAVSPRFNIGEAVISSALWHFGVDRLERVVISHPQRDHMAGMARVLRNFPVGEVWLSRLTEADGNRPDVTELLSVARRFEVPVRQFDGPETIQEGMARVRILPPLPWSRSIKTNDLSLALEIEHGTHRVLLTGDMEAKAEQWLLTQGALRPVTVLLAPHHGSLSSSTPPFVAAARPRHVIFSVGAGNMWGFPKPEVLRRWTEAGATLWRTDRQGAIEVFSDGTEFRILPFRGEEAKEEDAEP
ncbi:MAG: DNA internalization-related competence protein ComEC/Rec2 [Magnetococcales bacterium]|nr:DNA internalization-related competence protein ComEC/Rec2 [Magnetococcales bacterium]